LFNDLDLRLHPEDKLITLFLASLKLECNNDNAFIIEGIVSPTIFFIFRGQIDVTLKEQKDHFLTLDNGCYFGDISFLFDLNNKYVYTVKDEQKAQVFSIDNKHLKSLFNRFQKFRKVMEIRAYRR
jgi:hypothetical protein